MGSLSKVDQMGEETGLNRLSAAVDPVSSSPMHAMEAPNELWEWLRLLNRRKALIIGSGLLAVALMALIIAQATPMYKASSRIMLDTRTFKVMSTEAALVRRRHAEPGRDPERARGHPVRVPHRPRRRSAGTGDQSGVQRHQAAGLPRQLAGSDPRALAFGHRLAAGAAPPRRTRSRQPAPARADATDDSDPAPSRRASAPSPAISASRCSAAPSSS